MNRKQRRALGKTGPEAPNPALTNVQRMFADAVHRHQVGQLRQAEALYRQVLATEPRHADSLNLLGVIAHQTGQYKIAAELIGVAKKINPKSALYRSNLGCALQAMGRCEEAVAAYRSATRLKQDYEDAHYNLGNALYELGRLEEAITAFDAAIRIMPDHAGAHNNRGTALRDIGQHDEAIAAFNKAIQCKPDYAKAHYNLGNALQQAGRLREAIPAYNAAIRFEPEYADAHNNAGLALEQLGLLEQAVSAFNNAIRADQNHAEAHNNLGNILKVLRRLDEAVTAYLAAICIKPDYADAHCNLGSALTDLGRVDEAIASYGLAAAHGHKTAEHLAAALQGRTTDAAPAEYVAGLFDFYAPKFDAQLTDLLGYQSPKLLRELIGKTHDRPRFSRMADLGCGTGLSGAAFRDIASELIGIDLSAKMTALAEEKKIYNRIIVGEIIDVLTECSERFDLFVLTDVMVYFGAVDLLFEAIARCAMPNARLAFTAEICNGNHFQLCQSGRYAHSRAYLEVQLAKIKATVLAWEIEELRKEKGVRCDGHCVVSALPAPSRNCVPALPPRPKN